MADFCYGRESPTLKATEIKLALGTVAAVAYSRMKNYSVGDGKDKPQILLLKKRHINPRSRHIGLLKNKQDSPI